MQGTDERREVIMTLEEQVQMTIDGYSKGSKELGIQLGRGYVTVRRWASHELEDLPPAAMLVPLMRATGDVRILKWMARQVGCAVIKMSKRLPKLGALTVLGFQKQFNELNAALLDRAMGKISKDKCVIAIEEAIEALLMAKRIVKEEGELPLGEGGQLCLQLDTKKANR